MLTKYRARRHQMVIANWDSDYPDPHAMAGTFASNPDNSDIAELKTVAWRASWNIPQMTRDVAAAARELDATKRQALYEDIQREHMKSAPIIEMFQEQQVIVEKKGVSGLLLAPSSYPDSYLELRKA
jgi:peptide/nickel transport system substrate-binding protein